MSSSSSSVSPFSPPRLYGKPPKPPAEDDDAVYFHVLYEDIMIPMRDGVRLAGDLYLPAIDGFVDLSRRWPCVLVRTPYNKSVVNPDLRHSGHYWTQNGYACFIQDCRGRYKSEGEFYKYTGEAEDGYDTVEWLATQSWSNGSIVTDGPSYLCHVQTSMAILRPPHLKAMFCNKGGFFNAHTSGVRNGGAYEARQWVWGLKQAPRKVPRIREAIERVESQFDEWLRRYPFLRGDSPLTCVPEYENYLFDQVENSDYNDYWKKIGLNTEEYLQEFADIPAIWLTGWYDIYVRSTIDFFVNLSPIKKSTMLLIVGPWQHVGPEDHVAGEVDFGVNALISGNLARSVFALARKWFDRWVDPASPPQPRKGSVVEQPVMKASEAEQDGKIDPEDEHCPYTSVSMKLKDSGESGPSPYLLPSALPREFDARRSGSAGSSRQEALPPMVRYFRMGGGDGHKTSQGCLFHGGVWMQCNQWPPEGNETTDFMLGKRKLIRGGLSASDRPKFDPELPSPALIQDNSSCSTFLYDPRDPCPSIGGNVFSHKNILLSGAYNQVERPDMFLCKPPYLPLASRRDVLVFRSDPLPERIEVTGMPTVTLYISSSCVDTDFTAKLIDEYPPSNDYPNGFALQITHGIRRCRYRNSREKAELMEPGKVYEILIELYPTSNLFAKGHRIRLDISSSNFPHFDINLNTGEGVDSKRWQIAENRVFHTDRFQSKISLPIQVNHSHPSPLTAVQAAKSR